MTKLSLLTAAAAFGLTALAPADAAVITSLFSTGVDANGVATTGNGADLHWTLDGGAAYTGGTNGTFPIGPWVSDTATSRWITPTPNAADAQPIGGYAYSTTFSLAGLNAATASLSGQVAADDIIFSIQVNTTPIVFFGGGYTLFTPFTINSGFVAGLNTLTIIANNSGGGPTGLNVLVGGTADPVGRTVPEPAAWALMVVGFGLVGAAARRRATVVAA